MSENTTPPSTGDRLQKIIAQAGLASRRDAEELIREGKVTVNGKTAKLGDKATLGQDSIKVRGKLIQSTEQKAYYIIYKPKNVIAMIAEDEEERPTLKEYTKRIPERVFTVGRMDFTSEGAILLTNDGEVAQKMQKANDIIRRYHVKVDRHPTPSDIEKLARGGRMDGKSIHPFHVRLATAYNRNALIEISFEGMSALDIRKFFENKGFFPERIACVGIGHINAEKIVPGTIKKIEASSVEALFTQPELAKTQIEKLMEKKTRFNTTQDEDGDKKEAAEIVITGRVRKEGGERPAKRFGGAGRGTPRDGFAGTRAPRGATSSDSRPARSEGFAPRGEGRFARGDSRGPRGDARSPRITPVGGESSGFAPRGEGRSFAPRGEGRPARSEGFAPRGDKPARSYAPRGEGFAARDSRGPRSDSRAPRAEGRSFAPRGGDSRAPRAGGYAPRGEGRSFAPRGEGRSDSRAPRSEGRSFAPRGEGRPARSAGARKPSAGGVRFKRS
jgi:23S rRNA pseudouridine2605 synthase